MQLHKENASCPTKGCDSPSYCRKVSLHDKTSLEKMLKYDGSQSATGRRATIKRPKILLHPTAQNR